VEQAQQPTALDIRVPTGKFVNVKVAGTTEFTFKNNELDCLDNDVCNIGTVFTDYISMSSGNANVRVWGHLDPISDDDYDLGASGLQWRNIYIDGTAYLEAFGSQSMTLPTSNGINGQVLTTNGTSALSWETPSGGGGWVGTATSDLNMQGNDIEDVDQIDFQVIGQRIDGAPTGLEYEVPYGDTHKFYVNSSLKVTMSSSTITFSDFALFNDTVQLNGSMTVQGGGDIHLTTGGRFDFANDTGTPTGTGGYVKVKIGGADKFIPYYN